MRIRQHDVPPDTTRQLALAWLHLRPGLRDLPQSGDVDFGVDLCGLDGAVPEEGRDVLERGALAQHRGGYGMPKQVGCTSAWAGHTRSMQSRVDDHRDGTVRAEGLKRRAAADK